MKEIVRTDKAPRAIGPYSQAVRANGFVFLSGQIPIDPQTGEVAEGSVQEQTRRVLENIGGLLTGAGLDFKHVVKTTVFLKQMSDFQQMNEIYAEYFPSDPPARSTIEAAALPRNVQVEIDAIAIDDKR